MYSRYQVGVLILTVLVGGMILLVLFFTASGFMLAGALSRPADEGRPVTVVVLGAANETEAAVLLVNPTAQSTKLTMDRECDSWTIIDPRHTYQQVPVPADGLFRIPGLSVSLFRFGK